jgi:tetratricopeptide (TPR) repeat protein
MRRHKSFVFGASFSFSTIFIGAVVASVFGLETASAQTKDAALENCRQTVGRPIVQGCMQGGRGNLEACRALAKPKVMACLHAAVGAAGGDGKPSAKQGSVTSDDAKGSLTGVAVGRARALIKDAKYQEALSELNAAIAQNQNSDAAYGWRGFIYMRMGRFSEAMPDFDRALSINPKNAQVLINRGFAFYGMKDNGRGLADLNAATEIDPSLPGAFAFRGLIYSDMGEQDRALTELNKAIQLNPNYPVSYANLGSVYNKLQQYDKAVAAYDQALQRDPHALGSLSGRGFAYLSLGEPDRALADLNQALQINPKYTRVLNNRGRIYLDKGQYETAIKDFNDILSVDPQNVAALLQRAKAFEQSRNLSGARADFQAALNIIPSHGVATAGLERIDGKIAAASGGKRPVIDHAGVRVALVIGNSHYKAVDTLANPERDAKLLAAAFNRSGFEKVQLVIDGTRDGLLAALKSFAADAANADWAVVYYAGHGIELDGSNYLVPIDVKYENDADIPKESLALDEILNAVGAASKLRLVILDACRENPFVAELKGAQTSGAGRGLARIEPESGTLVAFATKHGHLATDGAGEDSPFATALVQRIAMPGLEISQMFRLVHDDVYAGTDKKQEPFTYGQLSAQGFYFKAR